MPTMVSPVGELVTMAPLANGSRWSAGAVVRRVLTFVMPVLVAAVAAVPAAFLSILLYVWTLPTRQSAAEILLQSAWLTQRAAVLAIPVAIVVGICAVFLARCWMRNGIQLASMAGGAMMGAMMARNAPHVSNRLAIVCCMLGCSAVSTVILVVWEMRDRRASSGAPRPGRT
jgi:hypothetical protein